MKTILAIFAALMVAASPAAAIGLQISEAPDVDGAPIPLAIWHPSDATGTLQSVGPFLQTVALNAPVSGARLPLILFSHGTGGSGMNSADSAAALAEAGFIVVAITHPGDNFRDQSAAFTPQNFANRARHARRALDHLLTAWTGAAQIDPARIGVFGHSAGGATALLLIGGRADFARMVAFCAAQPEDWGCRNARERGAVDPSAPLPTLIAPDPRVRAAALAAPALAAVFAPDGLDQVTAPVQVWVGLRDDIVTDAATLRDFSARIDLRRVERGGHMSFLAPCNETLRARAPFLCKDPDGFDRPAFLAHFQSELIAFFRANLR